MSCPDPLVLSQLARRRAAAPPRRRRSAATSTTAPPAARWLERLAARARARLRALPRAAIAPRVTAAGRRMPARRARIAGWLDRAVPARRARGDEPPSRGMRRLSRGSAAQRARLFARLDATPSAAGAGRAARARRRRAGRNAARRGDRSAALVVRVDARRSDAAREPPARAAARARRAADAVAARCAAPCPPRALSASDLPRRRRPDPRDGRAGRRRRRPHAGDRGQRPAVRSAASASSFAATAARSTRHAPTRAARSRMPRLEPGVLRGELPGDRHVVPARPAAHETSRGRSATRSGLVAGPFRDLGPAAMHAGRTVRDADASPLHVTILRHGDLIVVDLAEPGSLHSAQRDARRRRFLRDLAAEMDAPRRRGRGGGRPRRVRWRASAGSSSRTS